MVYYEGRVACGQKVTRTSADRRQTPVGVVSTTGVEPGVGPLPPPPLVEPLEPLPELVLGGVPLTEPEPEPPLEPEPESPLEPEPPPEPKPEPLPEPELLPESPPEPELPSELAARADPES
jgi:hypothetical protein